MRGGKNACPVCKSEISRENVIPLYGHGANNKHPAGNRSSETNETDDSVPGRPRAQHTPAPERRQSMPAPGPERPNNPWDPYGVHGNNNFAFTAGFGFFPSLFGLTFQTYGLGPPPPRANGRGPQMPRDEELHQLLLSRMLFIFGCLVILMLLFL